MALEAALGQTLSSRMRKKSKFTVISFTNSLASAHFDESCKFSKSFFFKLQEMPISFVQKHRQENTIDPKKLCLQLILSETNSVAQPLVELIVNDWVDLENMTVVFYQTFDRTPFVVVFHVHESSTKTTNHTSILVQVDVVSHD